MLISGVNGIYAMDKKEGQPGEMNAGTWKRGFRLILLS
jgi:hypothetical protein